MPLVIALAGLAPLFLLIMAARLNALIAFSIDSVARTSPAII